MGRIFFIAEKQRDLKLQITNEQLSNNIQYSMINFQTDQSYFSLDKMIFIKNKIIIKTFKWIVILMSRI